MFPNSPNVRLKLLKVENQQDSIGNRVIHLVEAKEVIGISFSITSKEFYESLRKDTRVDVAVKIQSFLYDGSNLVALNQTLYNVERTYHAGHFIELYLVESKVKLGEIDGYTG
jgi:hypothetical protein